MLETLFWIAAAQAAIGLVSLFALGDTLLGAAKPQYEGFATGTFVNRNSFATYVAAAIPMGIALLAGAGDAGDPVRRRWLAAARIAGLLLLVAALIASGSRMGLAAGIAGAGLAVALVLVGGRGRSAIVLAVAICALLVAAGFGAPLLQRIVEPSDDLANRLTLYSQVWDAILARPLFGYGGGSFATVFPMFQHAPLPGDLVWQRAHSTYLALWFEYGLVAGSMPMIVVAGLWLQCLRWLLRRPGNTTMLAVVTAVLVFALHSAVDFSLEIHAVALFFALLLGIGAGVARLGRP
jgi:O-antigen ligase